MAHLDCRLDIQPLTLVAAMIDPLGHLGVFQRVVDHPGPPLADRLHLRRGRRAYVELPRLRPQPVRLRRSEEHTSELQSLMRISYAVSCLKKKNVHRLLPT